MRLTCSVCGAGLVPSWTSLRCPRLGACGRGGLIESGLTLLPAALARTVPSGVSA